MGLRPLLAVDAGNALRPLYVLIGGTFPPPAIIPAEEELASDVRLALRRVLDGGDPMELRNLPARLRQTMQAQLVAFIRATEAEPMAVIAHLPPDAGEADRLRVAITWMLARTSERQH